MQTELDASGIEDTRIDPAKRRRVWVLRTETEDRVVEDVGQAEAARAAELLIVGESSRNLVGRQRADTVVPIQVAV